MKIRTVLIGLAVVVLALGFWVEPGLRAQATPSASGDGWFHRPLRMVFMHRMLSRLHVNDEQKQAALAVLRNHRPAIKPLVDELITEQTALRALFKAPTIDEAAVRAQSARVAVIEANLAVQKAYLIHDLRAVATADQLKKCDEMEAEAQEHITQIVERVNAWIMNS